MRAAAAILATLALATPAYAQGEGENMELVANHALDGAGTDLELAGDYAYVGYSGGLAIVDISNPADPKRAGTLECGANVGDLALSTDATLAFISSDGSLGDCGEGSGTAIVDVTDKTHPQVLSSIATEVGSHTITLDGHVLSSNNYASDEVLLFDVSDPRSPKPLATSATPGPSAFHDAYFDHRPDGKVLLYGASGEGHDVFDVTDPAKPVHLQRVIDPEVSFSHQAEPNFKRDLIVVSDEWQGGRTAGACGRMAATPADPLPLLGTATDLGAYHFYRAEPTGLYTGTAEKLGTFNLPFEAPQTGGCTSHVFWQAPDANRMTAGWYVHGTRVIDFSDPANAKEIGWFVPDGANTWSAKPHRGYIFTGDLGRGMDVLRYTGDGWPKAAGPAEVQRRAQQGFAKPAALPPLPAVAPPAPAARNLGRARFTARVKVPGRRGRRAKLAFAFADAGGAVVARASIRRAAGRRAVIRGSGVAEAGAYRYVVRVGKRVLARGRFTVRPASGLSLPANRRARIRLR